MQLTFELNGETALIQKIHVRLLAHFGRPDPAWLLDPVSQLAMGIIGCRSDSNASRLAHLGLLHRFGDWEGVRDASHQSVQDAMLGLNFDDTKATRLRSSLRTITQIRGRLELDFLAGWTVEAALIWLERLYGVGRKVAAVTLNFSTLRKRCLVIDTHGLRVLSRFGLIGSADEYAAAYDRIMPLVPAEWTVNDVDEHHQLVKRLGQEYCRPSVPKCWACPLNDICVTGMKRSNAYGSPRRPDGVFDQKTVAPLPNRACSISPAGRVSRNSHRWERREFLDDFPR